MKFAAPSVIVFSLAVFLSAPHGAETPLDPVIQNLQTAKSLTAKFKLISSDAAPGEGTLSYQKPDMFRIDTPGRLTVSDGKTVWDLNKASNTYTEEPAALTRINEDDVWAWAGFFDKATLKDATEITEGTPRSLGGIPVHEWSLQLSKGRSVTLHVDPNLMLPRDAMIKFGEKTVNTVASDLKASSDELPASTFAFSPPADAKKIDKPKPALIDYSKVDAIMQSRCVDCHSGDRARQGLDLSSYDHMMMGSRNGKVVAPGDPASSLLLGVVSGTKNPKMPPRGDSLTAAEIATIEGWIKAGAKGP